MNEYLVQLFPSNINDLISAYAASTVYRSLNARIPKTHEWFHHISNGMYPRELIRWFLRRDHPSLGKRQIMASLKDNGHIQTYATDSQFTGFLNADSSPIKFHCGAMMADSEGGGPKRELVFDFDIQDYDTEREATGSCACRKKNVCEKCWMFTRMSMGIVSDLIQSHFGFTPVMPVFSGGGGGHVWILDPNACLTAGAAGGVLDFFSLIEKKEKPTPPYARFNVWNDTFSRHGQMNPNVQGFYDVCIRYFEDVIVTRLDLFGQDARARRIREACWGQDAKTNSADSLYKFTTWDSKYVTSVDRWKSLQINLYEGVTRYKHHSFRLMGPLWKLVFSLTWPRFDRNVTAVVSHFVGLPFTIHPRTGYISVPLDGANLSNITLADIPNLHTSSDLGRALQPFHDLFRIYLTRRDALFSPPPPPPLLRASQQKRPRPPSLIKSTPFRRFLRDSKSMEF